jgi:DNA-binding GntR family transcriptional regulator
MPCDSLGKPMKKQLDLERPRLLTDVVGERIQQAIVQGDLKLGEQMSEAQLAARMGVSKTPVREALVRLQAQGLVEIHPQRGSYVFRLTPDEVTRLCRFRALVETEALRDALGNNRKKLIQSWQQSLKEMKSAEAAQDLASLARIDMTFHFQMFEASTNRYLASAYDLMRLQLTALRYRAPITNAVKSHQVLIDAAIDNDIQKVCDLLGEHILSNEPRYITACALS